MNRTRTIFIAILAVAVLIVIGSVAYTTLSGGNTPGELTVARPDAVKIRILTALPVEPWVRSAAAAFNAGDHRVDGVPIQVEIVAVDGLTALGRWDRNEYGALATATRPEDLTDEQAARWTTFPPPGSQTAAIWSSLPTPPTKNGWVAMSF